MIPLWVFRVSLGVLAFLGVLDSFGLLAAWVFGSFAFSISGLSGSSAFQGIGIAFRSTAGGGADQTIKRREFFAFFLSCYTTFREVFNILDLLGYIERGVRRASF
jgi:hypothetical protein